MTHHTPILPVRQMYHTCMCPHCNAQMWADGTCTNCNYDYAIDEFKKPVVGVMLWLMTFAAAIWAVLLVAL
jgi:hypothetical protein